VGRAPTRSGRRCGLLTESVKGALLLAHEFLESLGLSAAQGFNRGGRFQRRRTGGPGADRPPELRQMLGRVLVEAPLQNPVVPELVRDFVVAHLPAEDPAEGRDNVPYGKHLADHWVRTAREDRRGRQHTGGDARDVLARHCPLLSTT